MSDGEKAWPLTGADAAPGWDWVEGYLRKWCRNGRRCTRLGARSKTYDGHSRVRYMVWRDSWRGTQAVNRQDILMSRDQFSSWKTLEFNFHHVVSFTHTQTSINRWFLKYITEQRLERTDSMKPTAPHLQNTKDASFFTNLIYRIKRYNLWFKVTLTCCNLDELENVTLNSPYKDV